MGTFLIAGASSGIGEACAKKMSEDGHLVVLVARSIDKLQTVANSLSGESYIYSYDLEDCSNVRSIFDFCKNENLKLDGLIYSAGMNADVPIKACTPALFEKVLKINCIAFTEMGKCFYNKKYSNDNSRIVAISSSASIACDKGMGPYSASKSALNAIVKTMSKEFVRRGILVNALLPAGVLTPMAVKKIETISGYTIDLDAAIRDIESKPVEVKESEAQPYGIITPKYIADIVAYLVSLDNRYVTGALIPVSAGLSF